MFPIGNNEEVGIYLATKQKVPLTKLEKPKQWRRLNTLATKHQWATKKFWINTKGSDWNVTAIKHNLSKAQ